MEQKLIMYTDRVMVRVSVSVWLDFQAPPIMCREAELDVKLQPLVLQ